MKQKHYYLFLAIPLLMSSVLHSTSAYQYYDDEYRFLQSITDWMQVEGYENNSYSYVNQRLLEVIDYTDENITYLENDGFRIHIQVYNYSLHESFLWIGPIGFDFINANQMEYYYDLWNNQENLTEAYAHIIGTGYTEDYRIAEHFVFKANLSTLLENQRVDFLYDQREEEIIEITDNYTLSLQIYVEYDSKGVLLKWKEKITVDGSIIQLEQITLNQRVDNFKNLETTDETSIASLFIAIISLLVLVRFSNRIGILRKYISNISR